MLNPTREQKAAYMALCDLHQALIKGLIEGQTIASVVKKCVRDFTEKNPSLVQYLPKNFGAGVGFQPRERALLLSAKNNRTIEYVPRCEYHRGCSAGEYTSLRAK